MRQFIRNIVFSLALYMCLAKRNYYFSATVFLFDFVSQFYVTCSPVLPFAQWRHFTTTTRVLFVNLVIPARFNLRPSSPIMASKAPRTRVSYSVQLSRDFSRLPKWRVCLKAKRGLNKQNPTLHKKAIPWRILIVVIKWRHHANSLFILITVDLCYR